MAKLTPEERENAVRAITKAIGYAENGGPPNLNDLHAGKTGEMKSIFQYTPATWKAYAKEYLGDADTPLTPDNETTVTMKKVGDLIDKGLDAKKIASIWNSGDENAYTGKFTDGSPSIGTNKEYGVKFNVPAYAKSVTTYAKQFYDEMQQKRPDSQTTGAQPQHLPSPSSATGLLPSAFQQTNS